MAAVRLAVRLWLAVAVPLMLIFLAGCTVTVPGRGVPAERFPGQGDSEPSETPSQPADCTYTPADSAVNPNLIDVGIPEDPEVSTEPVVLDVSSSRGDFQVALDPVNAPCASNSMSYLADKGFFDGSPCHRLVNLETFGVLQCGDPTGTGSGGPTYNYTAELGSLVDLPDGDSPDTVVYPRGSVGMASGGEPQTIGSQFFICFQDTQLSPDYTLVGTITSGIEVIEAVAAGGNDGSYDSGPGGGAPLLPVTLATVTVQG